MAKRPITVDDLSQLVFLGDPQISPDGTNILFAKKVVDEKKKYLTQLCSVDLSGAVKQWTQGAESAGSGRWAPDGSAIAFVADRDKKGAQIYLIPTVGGEARKLSKLNEGAIGELRWSPDAKLIAFTFRETAEPFTKKAQKVRESDGGATPPVEIDDIWYRMDGDGTFGNQRFKLFVLEVASGTARELYNGDPLGMYAFDWAPESNELAVIHSAKPKPFIGPPDDRLFRVDLSGKATKLAGLPAGDKGAPRWSPDGSLIAYIGDTHADDPWGTRNRKLYVVQAAGGEPRCLTADHDYCLAAGTLGDTKEAGSDSPVYWAPDGSGLYVQVGTKGEQQLGWVDLDGDMQLLSSGRHCLTLGNMSRDGTLFAATYTNATIAAEIAILDLRGDAPLEPKRLTSFNKAFHDEIEVRIPVEAWVDSTDGVKVHAWVLEPKGKGPHPAVLAVHGGPHAQYGWTFFHEMQLLAANGYLVVYSNPRGSKGYGEKFCGAIKGDWGNKDWDDVQAVTAWMQAHPSVDSSRVGIMGGSYGGYMTNWAIGHSKAYKAAITDRCVSNLVSMSGSSDFPLNPNGYFGGVAWGDLKDIEPLWRQSPIAFFKGVSTPTLVIHSEGDLRCNIEQSEQVFHALQMQEVPSRFVRYPKETSHGMSRTGPLDLRVHRLNEILAWWKKYL